jgi:mono/diheme cytochrome c family protein
VKRRIAKDGLAKVLGAIMIGMFSIPGFADEKAHQMEDQHMKIWKISNGGILYDDWATSLMTSLPDNTHPSYPSTGKQKGGPTWRCKECHGWDYMGKDGAYGKGARHTGIRGISGMTGKPVDSIKNIIRDKTHGYTKEILPDKALDKLALFVSHGQVVMSKYIDTNTKIVKGDAKRGARIFQTICAICHGYDGKSINFQHDKHGAPEYIGTVAKDNPWEVLHKIRNGQPGIPMVALPVLDIQEQIDILTYAQTLPIM